MSLYQRPFFVLSVCLLTLFLSACSLFSKTCVPDRITADCESNPLLAGWRGSRSQHRPFDGEWTDFRAEDQDNYLIVRQGGWESPLIRCRFGEIYRLSFEARAAQPGYWRAFFYNRRGREIHADNYSRLYAEGESWSQQVFFLEGRKHTRFVKIGFDPRGEKGLQLDDIQFRPASRHEALAWIDERAAEIPQLQYNQPPNRWEHLPRTRETLQNGGKLRVVMLGDSIANDVTNSLFHLQLERHYPEAEIEMIRSVRSGTGCQYYRREGKVGEYVTRYEPDLLIIGGISHGRNAGAIREVIKRTRKQSDPEVLVMSGAISRFLPYRYHKDGKRILVTREEQLKRNNEFRERLAQMCDEMNVAYLDMRGVWKDYLSRVERDGDWFRRDNIHANSRGKRVLGEIMRRFFWDEAVPAAGDTARE